MSYRVGGAPCLASSILRLISIYVKYDDDRIMIVPPQPPSAPMLAGTRGRHPASVGPSNTFFSEGAVASTRLGVVLIRTAQRLVSRSLGGRWIHSVVGHGSRCVMVPEGEGDGLNALSASRRELKRRASKEFSCRIFGVRVLHGGECCTRSSIPACRSSVDTRIRGPFVFSP